MRIGELARRSGLAASRIRFYEAAGLLNTVQRGANGYREYPPQALQVLEIIACAQQGGFSLEEIRPLLPQPQGTQWHREQLLETLRRKVADIERLQKRLAASRRQLLEVIDNIEHKPAEVQCADNLQVVLAKMRAPRRTKAAA